MKPLISFDSDKRIFHLSNKTISYIFMIEEGDVLAHHYFGKAIVDYHGQRLYPRKDRGFSGNLDSFPVREYGEKVAGPRADRGYALDSILREYSSSGESDFRIPSLIVKQENGSQATRFAYKEHAIQAGKPTLEGLPATYVLDNSEAETLVVTLEDKVAQLELDLLYTIYAERSVIIRSSRLRNVGEQAVQIEKIASLTIDFTNDTYDILALPGAHVNERQIQRRPLGYGQQRFASRRGTTSHQMSNFIALLSPQTTENQGDTYGFNLVYSGNHAMEVERDQFGQVRVQAGINEEGFSWELAPQASFQTPEVLAVYSDQGLNGMSQTYHHLINERLTRGKHKGQTRPVLINNWEGTYFGFTEEKLKEIVDEAKALGLEMFVLDDGWFGHRDHDDSSLGDWFVNPEKFPNGLQSFADYVHAQGLQFGLWFEPEMISRDSELFYRHPDFALQIPDRRIIPSREQYVLDMGREDVRDHIKSQLFALLDQSYIDYIKWDVNRSISDAYSFGLPSHRQGEVLHRYVLGLYELLEELTSRYPDILFEGCSGGGGRFDTGIAYYMPQSWTSDNTDAYARLGIQYGTSLVYPTSVMTSHVSVVPNHQTGRVTSLATRADVAMSGVLGYELDLTKLTADEKEQVRQQIAFYKSVRQVIQYGDFYRIKSPFEGNETAWVYVSKDKKELIAFTFACLNQAQPPIVLTKLVGLDNSAIYQNVDTGECYGGDELMSIGFYQPFAQGDFTSYRYHFKAVE